MLSTQYTLQRIILSIQSLILIQSLLQILFLRPFLLLHHFKSMKYLKINQKTNVPYLSHGSRSFQFGSNFTESRTLNNNSKIVKLLTPNNDDFGRYEIVTKNKVRCQKKMLFNEAMAKRICKGI